MRSSIGSMPKFDSELVHCGFEPERADRFAWRAHEGVGDHIHLYRLDVQGEGLRRVDAFRRQDEGLGHVVVRSHRDYAGVDQGVEPAIGLRAQRHALFRHRAAADDTEHTLARQHDPHRPAGELRRRGRQNLMLPKELASETAAHERRGEAHLLFLQPEHLGNRPGFVRHRLRGIVDSQLVALPGKGAGVQLDRSVVMAGRRVLDIDFAGRSRKRSLGVADLLLQRLAQEHPGLGSLGLGGGKRDDRVLLFISDADQSSAHARPALASRRAQ